MATFEVLFKAWASQMTEHIKDIRDALQIAETAITKKSGECNERVDKLDIKFQQLREDFIIHKTQINTRIAMITGGIALILLITTLILNIDKIRNLSHHNDDNTEITK